MRRALLLVGAILITACVTVCAMLHATKVTAPNVSDASQWSTIKTEFVGTRRTFVRVLSFKHDSTDRDPYDVRLTRIIVSDTGRAYEYGWPPGASFAAQWAEVFELPDGSLAVALFETANVLRVVHFANGTFIFRSDKDEVISPVPLAYADFDHDGQPEFVRIADGSKANSVMHWTEMAGFVDVSDVYSDLR